MSDDAAATPVDEASLHDTELAAAMRMLELQEDFVQRLTADIARVTSERDALTGERDRLRHEVDLLARQLDDSERHVRRLQTNERELLRQLQPLERLRAVYRRVPGGSALVRALRRVLR